MNPLLRALVAAGLLSPDEAERINRTLDPDAARIYAETQIERAFANGLNGQQRRVLELARSANGVPSAMQLNDFWRNEDDLLHVSVNGTLQDVATERAITVAITAQAPDTWRLVNERVLDWLDDYYIDADGLTYGSIPNLNLTSRTRFASAFRDWQRGEFAAAGGFQEGVPTLVRAITPIFGPERAERIAVTETTRIFSETLNQAAQANPTVTAFRLLTSADELVCPICGPLHRQIIIKTETGFIHPTLGPIGFPPFHVRCRCQMLEETALTVNLPSAPEERFEFEGELPSA